MFDLSAIAPVHFSKHRSQVAVAVVLLATVASSAQPPRTGSDLSEAAFRQGLRERGLTDWLELYLEDTPPVDEADAKFREYERLVADANSETKLPLQREALFEQADAILSELIAGYPGHPQRMYWSMALARDLLEKRNPAAFDAVLLYDLPGRQRTKAYGLSSEAVDVLIALRAHIAQRWKTFEALDERSLNATVAAGRTRELERVDAASALLLTWAQLYEALSGQRQETFDELLMRITDVYRWHESQDGSEIQKANAHLMAAIAARETNRFAIAGQHARQAIATAEKIASADNQNRKESLLLLARLERIRTLRDNNRIDEALAELRKFQARTNDTDFTMSLTFALTECSILAVQSNAARATAETLLQSQDVLAPLQSFAFQSVEQRDHLYAALVGAFDKEPLDKLEEPLVVQLALGSVLTDALMQQAVSKPAEHVQLEQAMTAAHRILTTAAIRTPVAIRGELLYLLGATEESVGDRAAAIETFLELTEQYPEHGRTSAAVSRALMIARVHLTQASEGDKPAARLLFIRAGQTLRRLKPNSKEANEVQYYIALATEHNKRFLQAAREYALVPVTDTNALRAALGRIRCLRNLHETTSDTGKAGNLLKQMLEAARHGAEIAQQTEATENGDRCLAGEITLTLATMLNNEAVNRPADAVKVLDRFEERFEGCDAILGPALRQRIQALQKLNQLGLAREAVAKFVDSNPQSAGPVMAALLEATRSEINAAADKDQTAIVKHLAVEAAALAEKLIRWSEEHADSVEPNDLLTMRSWYAWALLHADRVSESLKVYDECLKADPRLLPKESSLRTEIRLGQAQCLLQLDRPDDALPIFIEIWHTSFEHSPHWWWAFTGSLDAHTRRGSDPKPIIQSIRQQELLAPDLGGPRYKRLLKQIETANNVRMGKTTLPKPNTTTTE
jgi:hypothetical protein